MTTIAPRTTLKFFDAFSGIGGFALPFTELGCECIGFSEIDARASAVYLRHFPNHHAYGDITTIDATALPDFDLFCGGFPCQAFSIAGKRRGFGDTRGTLFFDVCRIAEAKRPRLLLLENVKGLLSHARGETFGTILSALDGLGYDLQWQVCNSRHFGVPQNRERVFIVGHLGGTPRPEVFPIGPDDEAAPRRDPDLHQLSDGTVLARWQNSETGLVLDDCAPTLRASDGGYTPRKHAVVVHRVVPNGHKARGYWKPDHVAGAVTAQQFSNAGTRIIEQTNESPGRIRYLNDVPNMEHVPQDNRVFSHEGVSPTVNTANNIGKVHDGLSIRRLTPLEFERLQGYPDGWTTEHSDTQRYKMCGNSVTVNVVREIVRRLVTPTGGVPCRTES